MVTSLTLSMLVLTFIVSANSANVTSRSQNLNVAIQEMRRATYFSFVMLISLYPPERIPQNITFLMPNDRMLSEVYLRDDALYNFLLRHSIPSPLLFDHLERFPTGSTIPTSEPDFMLRIRNNGRRNFFLNNVQIISPNICMAGSSIRCHGIKGVLAPVKTADNTSLPEPTCSPAPTTVVAPSTPNSPAPPATPNTNTGPPRPKPPSQPANPPTPSEPANPPTPSEPAHPPIPSQPANPTRPSPPVPSESPLNQITITAPPPTNSKIRPKKSDSTQQVPGGFFHHILPCLILALVTFQI